jgi:hypothetical protein
LKSKKAEKSRVGMHGASGNKVSPTKRNTWKVLKLTSKRSGQWNIKSQ